jgi:[acyl-carrier-protein] S-malonyltransferase
VLAIVCPGQGSQSPGFLRPWLEIPQVAQTVDWLGTVAGLDLAAHGTTSDAETIRDTAVAQPLIVAAGLAGASALPPGGGDLALVADVVAGHSVGELTAAALVGVLSDEQAVVLVRERGRGMAAASAVTPTGMSAVLGGNPDEVTSAISAHGLTAANRNGAGQVVAAGTLDQLAALAADPPPKARVVALQVAGAFHTEHMAPAVATLARLARAITPGYPRTRLLSNADGAVVTTGREALARIVDQVSNPVRWDACMDTMRELGVTGLLELPPAGALAGLAKRALPGVEIVALKTPDDLPAARALVETHAVGAAGSAAAAPSIAAGLTPASGGTA